MERRIFLEENKYYDASFYPVTLQLLIFERLLCDRLSLFISNLALELGPTSLSRCCLLDYDLF